MIKCKQQRGDTLIEVMLALTLLSAILFISWAIVNRSTQISAAARQRVTVVNQLKEQAEILKSLYAADKNNVVVERDFGEATAYEVIADAAVGDQIPANPCTSRSENGTIAPTNAFHFNAQAQPQTGVKSRLNDSALEAVWIQMNGGTAKGYMDFYIRACWISGSGSVEKNDNSQVIVRLNTP